jgi:hypothetical protein
MAMKGKVVISCAVTGSSTLSASDNCVCAASIGFCAKYVHSALSERIARR